MNQSNNNLCILTENKLSCMIFTNLVLNMFVVIFIVAIVGYVAPLVGDANILIHDSQNTISDLNEIIPDVKSTLHMVKQICTFENFTKNYGFLCQ